MAYRGAAGVTSEPSQSGGEARVPDVAVAIDPSIPLCISSSGGVRIADTHSASYGQERIMKRGERGLHIRSCACLGAFTRFSKVLRTATFALNLKPDPLWTPSRPPLDHPFRPQSETECGPSHGRP
eukprot:623380-Prorocentrum_minimum.AAC.1